MSAQIDILLVQEPTRSRVTGPTWLIDKQKDAAIKKLNSNINFHNIWAGDGFVMTELVNFILYSCYVSPNISVDNFIEYLQHLTMSVAEQRKPCIICGDFNSKSVMWGALRTDRRGEILTEWLAAHDLTVVNTGNSPTFVRGNSGSHIDLTICSENIARKITSWRVMEEETLSYHRYIYFEIVMSEDQIPIGLVQRLKGWHIDSKLLPRFTETFRKMAITWKECFQKDLQADTLTRIITEACDVTFKRRSTNTRRRKAYWWSVEIAECWRTCNKTRRKLKRMRRRNPILAEEIKNQYTNLRNNLKKSIVEAKEAKWKELIDEVDKDPWGKAYKIVTGKIGYRPPLNLTQEEEVRIAKELFPSDHIRTKLTYDIQAEDIPLIHSAEVLVAARRIKGKKSPGIDNINPEIIKAVASNFPDTVAEAFNCVLLTGQLPEMWKTSKLILMEKKTLDPNAPKKYRPLCLLNCLGKLFESVIVYRLTNELEEKGPLSENQYGFTKGRSTIDAIGVIRRKVDSNIGKHRSNRKLQMLTTVDIQNAFNMASWRLIVEQLEEKGISPYLRRIIESYLEDRFIVVGRNEERLRCTRGVPQGSVLGPTLWNVLYDIVLRESLPDGVTIIGYADDTAIITEAKTVEDLKWITNMAISRITEAIKERDLTIAAQKTEAVLLYGGRKIKSVTVKVENEEIQTKEHLKYLGVIIERNCKMGLHIKTVAQKGARVANTLSRIMPNTRGPAENRRKLLRSVVLSIVLYASSIWQDALKYKIHNNTLKKSCRTACLRVCRGYRTISYEALGVISSMMPIDLLVETRSNNTEEKREECLATWQTRWTETTKGVWTRTLIPEIKPWIGRKHGQLTFEITQFLSGHGKFGSYLKRFKIIADDGCASCQTADTPEHTFFECRNFTTERRTLEEALGSAFRTTNAVQHMLESESKWDLVENYVRKIITIKRGLGNQSH
ncbi:hypothetical protein M8J76_006122 [Diaphorina citri]|nr:hypothetical protein M8J76_006122 [Diaphorina citri]KAI5729026.1 hypothetical protein M8J77_024381 [Diaphorina citri]